MKNERGLSRNYVFFWEKTDYYRTAFAEIIGCEEVMYIDKLPDINNPLIDAVHKLHNSSRLNSLINMPYRNKWFDYYFKDIFIHKKPLVFIFHAGYYWLKSSRYFEYLKDKYREAYFVFFFTDVVDRYKNYYSNRFQCGFDLEYIRKSFDLILTYNKVDAQRYGLTYYPTAYTLSNDIGVSDFLYDVFFVGLAKDRLDEIHDVFESLTEKGFICDFYIAGVKKSQMKYPNVIHYNQKLTYDQVIEKVKKSKGILEIVQKDSCGFTFRLHEALVYDKNLITNNPIVKEIPYGASGKIFMLNKLKNINKLLYEKMCLESYEYQAEYTPYNLLVFIEKMISYY